MRIGELSRQSGVPVPTVKYYVRQGLLPAGERTHANQVRYSEAHLRRLRLVRAMIDVGKLPISTVREMMAEVDSPDRDLNGLLGILSRTFADRTDTAAGPVDEQTLDDASGLLRRHGYAHAPESAYVRDVADVMATFRRLGHGDQLESFMDTYAAAAMRVAEVDLDSISGFADRESTAEAMIVGTVLGEALFSAMRRLGQATVSRTTFPQDTGSTGEARPDAPDRYR
ncbi:MerR family transcriptional regulator [Streptomonospora litoralis]|uniref:Mercuric resistance operon regulatory protein n=1 Tax=Streptomonospora litoralis TaxID=2498135 RepID=A0A4P6QAX4_9ACTN|nr:MerR family transcriptional regulator [Streptomonospora litoralis]QBI56487.1 Mercuric resistance operon regulatory protein [Streptomonospora litoralis]